MELPTLKESVEKSIASETSISAANEESTKETGTNIRENSKSESATPEDSISVANNESTQETEINIKKNTQNTNDESINLEASTSSANRHIVRVDISPEVLMLERSSGNTNESAALTRSPQRRSRRSLRPISGLPTIIEDIVVSISTDPQPSTSGLNNRLERPRDDNIYDSSDDSSFDDSLDRHNQPFLIGVWNGPPEINPSVILLIILGVIFAVLMGTYIHNIQPVYA